MKKRKQTKFFAFVLVTAFLLVSGGYCQILAADRTIGEPRREAGKKNPLKNLYFGEQHMHTRNSFDAFTIGVTQTWEQAYRFGRGEEVTLNTNGIKIKRRTPYDFVAISDHAEYYGVLKDLPDPKNPLSKTTIGSSTPGLKKANDASITIYFQAKSPGKDKESNWLPAPEGPFWPILRSYGPGKSILNGSWKLPQVKQVK